MKAFLMGFVWAARGITCAVYTQRNFRFHLCAATFAYMLSVFYMFTALHYIALTIMVCLVLALELVNTAIEQVVDALVKQERSPAAAMVKDLAAGAVLVASVAAAVCGVILFWDIYILKTLLTYLILNPISLVFLLLYLLAGFCFIFIFGKKKGN